jgi:Stage II sporulation protein M
VEAQDFVLVQGLRDTRATLERWNARPGRVLWSWLAGSLFVVAALLLAVWAVALLSTPDPGGLAIAGLNRPASLEAVGGVLFRNSLVLALHAMACVAGFIAGSSLPLEATKYGGVWRWVHDKAGPLAIGFVVCATTFSLITQAFVLGGGASTLAAQLGIPPGLLLVGLLPHALPELTVLFLPLAAWIIASRRGDWDQLLAATFVTVAIAVPVLIASAFVEVYVSPYLLRALSA